MVGEIAGGYRFPGDLQPPSFPLLGGLRRLIGGQEVFPAQRTARVLPGEQAQRVVVQWGAVSTGGSNFAEHLGEHFGWCSVT